MIEMKVLNRGDQMDATETAQEAKQQNIIDMAIGFTAMIPFFQERSVDLIKEKLTDLFGGLARIWTDEDFSRIHREFCQWFVKTIRLAKSGGPSAYGHAAKVLDIALKVYVYYCRMPDQEKAEALTPMLNGAIDTKIIRHLFKKLDDIYRKSYPQHYLWTIKMITKEDYDLLQRVIRQDIRDSFDNNILPVQYDDIMGLQLDR
ncbi:MAG: hypothetical protein PVG39_21530 [Desulfobacteraceae bacterium]